MGRYVADGEAVGVSSSVRSISNPNQPGRTSGIPSSSCAVAAEGPWRRSSTTMTLPNTTTVLIAIFMLEDDEDDGLLMLVLRLLLMMMTAVYCYSVRAVGASGTAKIERGLSWLGIY